MTCSVKIPISFAIVKQILISKYIMDKFDILGFGQPRIHGWWVIVLLV